MNIAKAISSMKGHRLHTLMFALLPDYLGLLGLALGVAGLYDAG